MIFDKEESKRVGIKVMRKPKAPAETPKEEKVSFVTEGKKEKKNKESKNDFFRDEE